MKILKWNKNLTDKETIKLAYWERNMLALKYAQGWYYDTESNFEGWSRCLCLDYGACNFHIPDDFDVGNLQQIGPNYDGHTTEEKWQKLFRRFEIKETE